MNYINRRRSGGWKRTLKDYMVPIIGGILVLVLIIFFFFKGNEEEDRNDENQTGIDVTFDSDGSEATLVYAGDRKKEMEGNAVLYKGEKVIVEQGSVSVKDGTSLDFRVNKLGELKYGENGNYEVTSGEVWLNAYASTDISMSFSSLKVDANSHLSMSQNEMGSSIYLISGFVEVANLVGKNTVLAPGEKITISRTDASNEDIDLSLLKENIDQFFIKSDWYILNKGVTYISEGLDDVNNSGTGGTSGGSNNNSSSNSSNIMLTFNNLIDSSNVSSSSINISGTYSNDEISKISVNGKEAVLDKIEKTFKFDNVSVSKYENDLVFKVMDDSNDVLSKFVYTVYYNAGSTSDGTQSSGNIFGNTQIYDVDGSQFTFTAPVTGNTYTTSESFITIRGKVLASGITAVTVNDYKLASFDGANWRYHASTDNNNLAMGTNVYEIKYFSGSDVVYTNYFTIIKKEVVETPSGTITQPDPTDDNSSNGNNLLF